MGPLSVRPSVCLSVLSVMLVHCGHTVGWIKMKLGAQASLGPGHTVLDGDPALPQKGGSNLRPMSIVAHIYGRPSQLLLNTSCDVRADRRTYRHADRAHCNTSHPYRGRGRISTWSLLSSAGDCDVDRCATSSSRCCASCERRGWGACRTWPSCSAAAIDRVTTTASSDVRPKTACTSSTSTSASPTRSARLSLSSLYYWISSLF